MNVSLIFMSQNQTLKYYDFKMGLIATVYKISTTVDTEWIEKITSTVTVLNQSFSYFPTLKFQLMSSI